MAKSFPLVTNAARRTPIPLWEVNHCGGTAVHESCGLSHLAGPRRVSAPSERQAAGGLGAECCPFLVSLFYSDHNHHKRTYLPSLLGRNKNT